MKNLKQTLRWTVVCWRLMPVVLQTAEGRYITPHEQHLVLSGELITACIDGHEASTWYQPSESKRSLANKRFFIRQKLSEGPGTYLDPWPRVTDAPPPFHENLRDPADPVWPSPWVFLGTVDEKFTHKGHEHAFDDYGEPDQPPGFRGHWCLDDFIAHFGRFPRTYTQVAAVEARYRIHSR